MLPLRRPPFRPALLGLPWLLAPSPILGLIALRSPARHGRARLPVKRPFRFAIAWRCSDLELVQLVPLLIGTVALWNRLKFSNSAA